MQFFLSNVALCGGGATGLPGHFFLRFQLPWLQFPPKPRWLPRKLLLFPCLISLLQHCGPPLNYAKDVVNTWPLLFVHDFCSTLPCTEAKKIEVQKHVIVRWGSQLIGGLRISLFSALPSTACQQHVFLQGYKMAATAAESSNVQKQAWRENEIAPVHFSLYHRKFPLQIPLDWVYTLTSRKLRNGVFEFSASLGTRGRLCWQERRIGNDC